MTSAGATITVIFDPAAELTSRLNDEKEFRFVEVPTTEGQQDAEEGGDVPGGDTPGGDTPGGEEPGGDSGDNGDNGGGDGPIGDAE